MSSAKRKTNLALGIIKAVLAYPVVVAVGLFVFLSFNLFVLPLMSVIQLVRLLVDPGFRRQVADAMEAQAETGKVYYHRGHTFARVEGGAVAVGPDEFANSLVAGGGWAVEPAAPGSSLEAGDTAWRFSLGNRSLEQVLPLSGTVIEVNAKLVRDPSLMSRTAFADLWIVKVRPSRAIREFNLLPLDAIRRLNSEVKDRLLARFSSQLGAVAADGGQLMPNLAEQLSDADWNDLVATEFKVL